MEPPTRTRTRTTSTSFLSLPKEIKYQILGYIATDTNTLHALRQVHPWLRAQIRTLDLRQQVLTVPVPSGHLVCYTCFRIRAGDEFEAYEEPRWIPRYESFFDLRRRKQTCYTCRSWRIPSAAMISR
ncbi:hypothetical protein XANCAGTX0491_008052 [Xanthoria calcicola]